MQIVNNAVHTNTRPPGLFHQSNVVLSHVCPSPFPHQSTHKFSFEVSYFQVFSKTTSRDVKACITQIQPL